MNTNWRLLALAGVFNALFAIAYRMAMGSRVGTETVVELGALALATGACTIAAGLWRRQLWLLALNGLALCAIGSLFLLWTFSWERPHSFLSIGLLLSVMAVSGAILELQTARRRSADRWLLSAAAVASTGFALAFLVIALRWIRLEHPQTLTVWMSSFFAFTAVSMVWAALRFRNTRIAGQFD